MDSRFNYYPDHVRSCNHSFMQGQLQVKNIVGDIEQALIVLSVFSGVVAIVSIVIILALAITTSILTIW